MLTKKKRTKRAKRKKPTFIYGKEKVNPYADVPLLPLFCEGTKPC